MIFDTSKDAKKRLRKYDRLTMLLFSTDRSKIIAPWDFSLYQNTPRISLQTSVFYQNFQARFFLATL